MTRRRSLIASSLLLAAPACESPAPAAAPPPPAPPPPAARAQPAPALPTLAPAPAPSNENVKIAGPTLGQPCGLDGMKATTDGGEEIKCYNGVWSPLDAGFVGVTRAGRARAGARRLRA